MHTNLQNKPFSLSPRYHCVLAQLNSVCVMCFYPRYIHSSAHYNLVLKLQKLMYFHQHARMIFTKVKLVQTKMKTIMIQQTKHKQTAYRGHQRGHSSPHTSQDTSSVQTANIIHRCYDNPSRYVRHRAQHQSQFTTQFVQEQTGNGATSYCTNGQK